MKYAKGENYERSSLQTEKFKFLVDEIHGKREVGEEVHQVCQEIGGKGCRRPGKAHEGDKEWSDYVKWAVEKIESYEKKGIN